MDRRRVRRPCLHSLRCSNEESYRRRTRRYLQISQLARCGGGFKFYELAPSLLNKDKYGNLVINKDYNADMLAAAMAAIGASLSRLMPNYIEARPQLGA